MTVGELKMGGTAVTMAAPEARPVAPPKAEASEGTPGKWLRALGRASDEGEALTKAAMARTHEMGPGELIALQAGIYRYSEVVDVATRLVDRASTDVKTVLQGQGQ